MAMFWWLSQKGVAEGSFFVILEKNRVPCPFCFLVAWKGCQVRVPFKHLMVCVSQGGWWERSFSIVFASWSHYQKFGSFFGNLRRVRQLKSYFWLILSRCEHASVELHCPFPIWSILIFLALSTYSPRFSSRVNCFISSLVRAFDKFKSRVYSVPAILLYLCLRYLRNILIVNILGQ